MGLALTVLAIILVTNAQAGDPIAAWNQISENAVKAGKHPLPVTSVEFAIVQLAIYDAVESIEGRYQPYYTPCARRDGLAERGCGKGWP